MAAILTSWKEIASYLGKGVRTVQRWEREMGLPVRRPKPKEKQIVLAFTDELEEWVRQQPPNATVHGRNSLQGRSSEYSARSLPLTARENGQFDRGELARMQSLLAEIVQQTRMLHQRTQDLLSCVNGFREGAVACADTGSDGSNGEFGPEPRGYDTAA